MYLYKPDFRYGLTCVQVTVEDNEESILDAEDDEFLAKKPGRKVRLVG